MSTRDNIGLGESDAVRNSHPALTINIPALSPFDVRFCTIFTLSEWTRAMSLGIIGPDDGIGYWGTLSGESNIKCFEARPTWATHIIWYNE